MNRWISTPTFLGQLNMSSTFGTFLGQHICLTLVLEQDKITESWNLRILIAEHLCSEFCWHGQFVMSPTQRLWIISWFRAFMVNWGRVFFDVGFVTLRALTCSLASDNWRYWACFSRSSRLISTRFEILSRLSISISVLISPLGWV